jgi:hypothetical protein
MVSHVRLLFLAVALCCLVALPFTTYSEAPPSAPPSQSPALAWASRLGGTPLNFVVENSYLYVRRHEQLIVVDIRNPATPQVVGETDPNVAQLHGVGLTWVNGYIYTSDEIIDVRTPTNPQMVGTIPTGFAKVVEGTRLYAYNTDPNLPCVLTTYDVANPAQPQWLAEEVFDGNGNCLEVADVDGNVMVLKVQDLDSAHLFLRDVTNPTAPATLSTITPTNTSILRDAKIVGNYLYTGIFRDGAETLMTIYDIADPVHPTVVAELDEPVGIYTVEDERLYVQEVFSTQRVISTWDLSNPIQPVQIGEYELGEGSSPYPICFQENHEYRLSGSTIEIRTLSNPNAPSLVGDYRGWRADTGVSNAGYLYTVDPDYSRDSVNLRVIDAREATSPTLVNTLSMAGFSSQNTLYLQGQTLYWGSTNGLKMVNIADPLSLTVQYEGTIVAPVALLAEGDILYAITHAEAPSQTHRLVTLNIADPTAPTLLGAIELADIVPNSLALQGNVLYIGASSEVLMADVTTPTTPTILGTVGESDTVNTVTVVDEHLYITEETENTLDIYSVTTPETPQHLTTYALPNVGSNVHAIEVNGSLAYVIYYNGMIAILDHSNPQAIRFLHLYDEHLMFGAEMDAEGKFLYLWGNASGLDIIEITDQPRLTLFLPQLSRQSTE